MLTVTRSLMRFALVGLLALAWAGIAPAGFNIGLDEPAPVGLERVDVGQTVLNQRLSGVVVVRAAGPDGSRASLSGDTHQACPPGEVDLPLALQGGVSTVHTVGASSDRAVHDYNARAPPFA